LAAQTAPRHARLEGKWQAKGEDEVRNIMVRSDSSAQFGDQVARWRVVGDSLWITLGDGVWQVYGMKLEGDKLKLAGGDLEKPVTLRRGGPPTARADSMAIPPPPPATQRARGLRLAQGVGVGDPPAAGGLDEADRLAPGAFGLGPARGPP